MKNIHMLYMKNTARLMMMSSVSLLQLKMVALTSLKVTVHVLYANHFLVTSSVGTCGIDHYFHLYLFASC